MDTERCTETATVLLDARHSGQLLNPLFGPGELSLVDAYAIQRAGLALRLARGERLIGWKLGYTSQAMRTQMGVDAPNYGPLTDVMRLDNGSVVGGSVGGAATQPKVEPELLVIVGHDGAVVRVHAALEVVDSVYVDYRFTLADNTADGSSAALFVVGPVLQVDPSNLADVRVELLVNGAVVETATGEAADGDPLRGLAWLRSQLQSRGEGLAAEQLVLTGGLTRAHPLTPGTTISARFDDHAVVTVTRFPASST